jgi:hypothetical protein
MFLENGRKPHILKMKGDPIKKNGRQPQFFANGILSKFV